MSHPAQPTTPLCVRIAATGDVLLAAGPDGTNQRGAPFLSDDVRQRLAACDIVLGNLECTLPGDGTTVPTEPRVVATPDMIRAVGAEGFNVVSLANNHTFDCLDAGFHNVRRQLGQLGVRSFGAGDNLTEAAAPVTVELRGLRIAFIAAADRSTGATRFAGQSSSGIAPFDIEQLVKQVHRTRDNADHVVLSLHWGEERLRLPSPTQIQFAHKLVDAGTSLIIGHHPHVLQGMELYHGVPILYSLGNFVASDVPCGKSDMLSWSRRERTGCLFLADLTAAGVANTRQVPTFDDGRMVVIDRSGRGDRTIARVNRALARGVTLSRYRREHLWIKTLKPALQHLRWSELRKLGPAKIRKAFAGISQARKAE